MLAKKVVHDFNNQRDAEGITSARKAMIKCGMPLNLKGRWKVQQLTPDLSRIAYEQNAHFLGEPVVEAQVSIGRVHVGGR